MIQSTKPASISGISAAMPSPAGVSAPVIVRPTVTSGLEHLFGEELARLAQPRRVVGEERPVDQVGDRLLAVDRSRIDARAAKEPASSLRRAPRPARSRSSAAVFCSAFGPPAVARLTAPDARRLQPEASASRLRFGTIARTRFVMSPIVEVGRPRSRAVVPPFAVESGACDAIRTRR